MTTKRTRRAKCNHCGMLVIEDWLINAKDCDDYQNNYGDDDDTLVWVDRNDNAMCYGTNFTVAHATDKEVRGN